ncbi:hypothetical protein HS7_19490 [Sulfolobales archaeon HS-7]|nr:hypothetical protein HS7_19490 [Sulfolobales archaeon HS-7]
MGVIGKDYFLEGVKRFKTKDQRFKLYELFERVPYQLINDSPTTKHYTDWTLYDKADLHLLPSSAEEVKIGYENAYSNVIRIVNGSVSGNIPYFDEPDNAFLNEPSKLDYLTLASAYKIRVTKPGIYAIYNINKENKLLSPINVELSLESGKAEIVYISDSAGGMNSAIIGGEVGKGAELDVRIVISGNNGLDYLRNNLLIYGKSNFNIFSTGTRMSHVKCSFFLYDWGTSNFSARAFSIEDNKIDISIDTTHLGINSQSNGLLKGASAERGYTSIRGIASITEKAFDSSTSIIGRSLILHNSAKAVVTPMLEVKTGRVREARHSASISRVNDEYIFYLQNRGFAKHYAESLIIRGFLIEDADIEEVKQIIMESLTKIGY